MSIAMLVLWMAMQGQASQTENWPICTGACMTTFHQPSLWRGGVGHAGPSDVPPIRVRDLSQPVGVDCLTPIKSWSDCQVRWICEDRQRILLTDESGGKHCIKF